MTIQISSWSSYIDICHYTHHSPTSFQCINECKVITDKNEDIVKFMVPGSLFNSLLIEFLN